MKRWSANNVPPAPSKEPNWKAIVRRLRDWLDRLLQEGGDTRVAEGLPDPMMSAGTSSPLPGDQGGALRSYGSEEEKAKVARWNVLRQPPPPEDWLRRVREGAPELLRLIEERQARTSGAPEQAIAADNLGGEGPPVPAPSTFATEPIEAGNPAREMRPASAPLPRLTAGPEIGPGNPPREGPPVSPPSPQFVRAAPSSSRQPADGVRSAGMTMASRAIPWFHLLRRRLKIMGPEQERGKGSLAAERPIHPTAEQHDIAATANPERPEAGESRPNGHTSQSEIAAASEPASTRKGSCTPLASRWSEVVRRKIQAVLLPRFLTNRPARMLEAVNSKERKSPTLGSTSASPQSKAVQPHAGYVTSRAVHTSSLIERPSGLSKQRGGGSKPLLPETEVAPSWPARHAWVPLPDELSKGQSQAPAHRDPPQLIGGQFQRSPAQTSYGWPALRSGAPELREADPWPALPEDQTRPVADPNQFFRNAEHLRALDFEQRGGR